MDKVADQHGRAPQNERDGATEQRILQAARSVFVRRGTAGARMQEIAAEAGVNQALLHYYFRSKDRLAEAVVREAAGRLVPAVLQLLGSDFSIEQKVERFVHLYIDTVRQNPFLPAYILAELNYHPERATALRAAIETGPGRIAGVLVERLGAQIEERVAAGEMRHMSPEQFVVNMLALVVFPFAARPVLELVFGFDDAAFARFLDERRAELPRFILDGMRP